MKKNPIVFGVLILIFLLSWFSIHLKSAELPVSKKDKPARCFYFAEGSTFPSWHTNFTVFNTGGTKAEVDVTFYTNNGGSKVHSIEVSPGSTNTVDANDILGKGTRFSSTFTSYQDVVVERSMFFNHNNCCNFTGGHSLVGATSPDTNWYFAEGSTQSGFETWICVMNPNESKAKVNINYALDNGTSFQEKIKVPGYSPYIVDPAKTVGTGQNFSAVVTSDIPIVAERPLYYNYQGHRSGGFTSFGVNNPGTDWYFAEGSTQDGFESWILIQNPNTNKSADVNITYMTSGGNTQMQYLTLLSHSRKKIYVNDVLQPGINFSAKVSSDKPILVERPMYFNYQNKWNGSSTSMGMPGPDTTWFLAEGRTGASWDTYITVQNPGDAAATVDLNYYCSPNDIENETISVPSQSCVSVCPEDSIGNVGRFSTKVESDQPVIAERSMYYAYSGKFADEDGTAAWTGGDSVMGFSPDLWERFSFSGSVIDRISGAVIKNAKIKIIGKSKGIKGTKKSTKSDKLGKYVLSNVPGGRYKLIVRKRGYYVHRDKIKIKFSINLNIKLEKK